MSAHSLFIALTNRALENARLRYWKKMRKSISKNKAKINIKSLSFQTAGGHYRISRSIISKSCFFAGVLRIAQIGTPPRKNNIRGTASMPHRRARCASASTSTVKNRTPFFALDTAPNTSAAKRLGPQKFAKNSTAAYLEARILLSKFASLRDFKKITALTNLKYYWQKQRDK